MSFNKNLTLLSFKLIIISLIIMPVKYLGKMYTASLNEKEQIQNVIKMIEEETKKIDKCKLPGRYKSTC